MNKYQLNKDQFKCDWPQFKDDLQKNWKDFSDDDLTEIEGELRKIRFPGAEKVSRQGRRYYSLGH